VDEDRRSGASPDEPSAVAWILGFTGAVLGVVGGILPFHRGHSFHWLDLGGDFFTHLPILGAVIRGLVAPALIAWAAYLGIGGRSRVGGPLMLGAGAVWLAWMLQYWLDFTSGGTGQKAGIGLFAMILGAVLAVAGGIIATMGTLRDETD
jgi:hypothetical protein